MKQTIVPTILFGLALVGLVTGNTVIAITAVIAFIADWALFARWWPRRPGPWDKPDT